jgi:hypothetical protein
MFIYIHRFAVQTCMCFIQISRLVHVCLSFSKSFPSPAAVYVHTPSKLIPMPSSLIRLVGGGVQLGPLGTAATDWPIVACPG